MVLDAAWVLLLAGSPPRAELLGRRAACRVEAVDWSFKPNDGDCAATLQPTNVALSAPMARNRYICTLLLPATTNECGFTHAANPARG